jgi:hypothetical protein
VTVEAGLGGAVAPAPAMIHVETEIEDRGGVRLQVESGLKLRLGVHLGGTRDEIGGGRARYLRRVKGR